MLNLVSYCCPTALILPKLKETLEEIKCFTTQYLPDFQPVVNYQINKLTKGNSYAEIVSREFSEAYMTKGLALAKAYQRGERDV